MSPARSKRRARRVPFAVDRGARIEPGIEPAAAAAPERASLKTRAGRVARRAPVLVGRRLVRAARWTRAHPVTAVALVAGGASMLGTVLWLAPALKVAATGALAPLVGAGLAGVLGVGLGGALASGARSLMVHITPMAIGHDPWNRRQLALDVSMSTGFGFLGFAQAAGLAALTGSVAVGVIATSATMLVGLVGWELAKDYLQIKIRNRVATYPKDFRDPTTFKKVLLMETLTNAHRALPGLGTSYIAKVVGDIAGTVVWDRLVNAHSVQEPSSRQKRSTRRAAPPVRDAASIAVGE